MTVPTIYNVTLTLANTEYNQQLPANCNRYDIQARTAADVRVAWETGRVATPTAPYATLKAGAAFTSEFVPQANAQDQITVYLASSAAGTVVEIVAHPRK